MKISRKLFVLLIVFLLITASIGYFYKSLRDYQSQKQELENYFQVYKNPFVLYLRKALNAYLANDSSNIGISSTAVKENNRKGVISGLDSFDKIYYKSKFVVLTINNSLFGGKDIQILFQEKPDRIFYVWVYKLTEDKYELRGFSSKESFNTQQMKEVIKNYEPYIFDKKHSF